jgi:hypothetical protein
MFIKALDNQSNECIIINQNNAVRVRCEIVHVVMRRGSLKYNLCERNRFLV